MKTDSPSEGRARALTWLRIHGRDATSFQTLEPGLAYFFDPSGFVAYAEVGRAWVAAGPPVADSGDLLSVARRFMDAAKRARKRVVFFGVEAPLATALGLDALYVGSEARFMPGDFDRAKAKSKRLREQLSRSRNKQVTVARLSGADVARERPAIDALLARWLRSRPMPTMGFVVELAPYFLPDERIYLCARRHGQIVGMLVAVPVYAERGLLLEDLLRDPEAPNGTTEQLVAALMQIAEEEGHQWVSMGLAPLCAPPAAESHRREPVAANSIAGHRPFAAPLHADDVAWPLRLARRWLSPLYGFEGVYRYKHKLGPSAWVPRYVAYRAGIIAPWVALKDVLAAFAHGRLLRFAAEFVARRADLVARAVAIILVVWMALLASAAPRWFPSPSVRLAWLIFDAGLLGMLLSLGRRYRAGRAWLLVAMLSLDGLLSSWQLMRHNWHDLHDAIDAGIAAAAVITPPACAALFAWLTLARTKLDRAATISPARSP